MPSIPAFHVSTSFEEAEAAWRALEKAGILAHYQRFDWLRPWFCHVGEPAGEALRIIVGTKEDKPLFVWPFSLVRRRGALQLIWLGTEHNNQNVGVWDPSFYHGISKDDALYLLRQVARQAGANSILLRNMPKEWAGRSFPLAVNAAKPSPSPIYCTDIIRPYEAFLQATHSTKAKRKLRQKHNSLKKYGDLTVEAVKTPDEAERALETFLEQRALRSRATGIPSGFEEEGTKAWLKDMLAPSLEQEDPLLLPYTLKIGGKIHATYLANITGSRIYAYSNSIAQDELMAHSPGIVLLADIIQDICDNAPKITEFDIGIGYEPYKTDWTKEVPLCDLTLGISVKGHISAMVSGGALRLKRAIKTNPHLWNAVRTLRRWRTKL